MHSQKTPIELLQVLTVAVALWLPFAYALVVLPLTIFIENQADFLNDITVLFPFATFAGLSLVLCLLLAVVFGWALKPRTCYWIAAIFLWLGVYCILSDGLVPPKSDNLIGFAGRESLQVSSRDIWIETALICGFVLAALLLRKKPVVQIGAIFSVAFVGSQAVLSIADLDKETIASYSSPSGAKWIKGRLPAKSTDIGGNIYHILLDGFSSYGFFDLLADAELKPADLSDFVVFPNNRSNYDSTHPSLSSFMSGTLYDKGSLRSWREKWKTNGIIPTMMHLGIPVWIYPSGANYDNVPFSYWRKSTTRTAEIRYLLGDLVIARLAPAYFHERFYKRGEGVISRFAKSKSPMQGLIALFKPRPTQSDNSEGINKKRIGYRVDKFQNLVEDERKRGAKGNYIFIHNYLPHGPFKLDKNCNERRESSYEAQATCTLRILSQFIQELKRLDRYDDALIVVHADHGYGGYGKPPHAIDLNAPAKTVKDVHLYWGDVVHLDQSTAALLMIKPPARAGTPLVRSKRTTQLLDIPATIYAAMNLPAKSPLGRSVMADDYPEVSEKPIYVGYFQHLILPPPPRATTSWFGRDIKTGYFNHFSFVPDKGWKINPNIPVSWH